MTRGAGSTVTPWLAEVALQAAYGRHVILVGAQDDRVFDGVYIGEPIAALAAQLRQPPVVFTHVVRWRPSHDPTDGATAERPGNDPDAAALELLNRVAEATDPTAVIVESAELVCDRLSEVGVDAIHRLFALPTGADRRSVSRIVVLSVSDPEGLPGVLRRDARAVRVRATRPDHGVRRSGLIAFSDQFHGWEEGGLDELVGLTDGMTLVDLQALAHHSGGFEQPMSQPRALIAHYRAGLKRDPWEALDETRVSAARKVLRAGVMGQDQILERVESKLRAARVGLSFGTDVSAGTRRPRMVLFLVGPTGVGKTELVRTLAEFVFGDRNALIRLDMAEYQQGHSSDRLGGAPPGYVGYGDASIADRVAERPFSVVLFDEIEKASAELWDRLLAILDDGRLTDGRGNTVSFGNTIVAFTSNLGSSEVAKHGAPETAVLEANCLAEVERHMVEKLNRPELFGRLEDSILPFDALRPPVIGGLVTKLTKGLRESARERFELELVLDDEEVAAAVRDALSDRKDGTWNGRNVRSEVERLVLEPLSAHLLEAGMPRGGHVRVDPRSGRVEPLRRVVA